MDPDTRSQQTRCGYTVKYHSGTVNDGSVCCWRESWDESGHCIWHSDSDSKPIEYLKTDRTEHKERFDEAKLDGVNIGDLISFRGCSLQRASIKKCELGWCKFVKL